MSGSDVAVALLGIYTVPDSGGDPYLRTLALHLGGKRRTRVFGNTVPEVHTTSFPAGKLS